MDRSLPQLQDYPMGHSSVQSLSHVSLRPHVLQNVRLPCPSPTLTQTHVYRVDDAIWAYGQWDAK